MATRFLVIFPPAMLLFSGIVVMLSRKEAAKERTAHAHDAVHIVDRLHELISLEFESIESDLLFLAQEKHLQDYLAGQAEAKGDVARMYARYASEKGIYDQIRYLDRSGREVVRVNRVKGRPVVAPDRDLQSKAHRYYFEPGMRLDRGEVFVSAFDLNVEHGEIEQPPKPVVRFATPVFDKDGWKRGLLVLNYRGARVIRKLGLASADAAGTVMLINPFGFWIHGPRPADDWGFMFDHERTFAREYPQAWEAISQSPAGQFVNDGGLFTFKTTGYAGRREHGRPSAPAGPVRADPLEGGENPFTIVSHIAPDELYAESDRLLNRLLWVCGVLAAPIMALSWFLAYTQAVHALDEERLRASEERLRTLSTQLIAAQEDDRRRLSRDLHDDLGQLITAVILDLQQSMQSRPPDETREWVVRALGGCRQLLEHIQEISSRLRPRMLDELGLEDAVRSYVGDFQAATGIVVQTTLDFQHHDIPPAVSENIFRIVQEALSNIRKHAGTDIASLDSSASRTRITLMVSDPGVGFEPGAVRARALGILGMRERVGLLGGEFELTSQPGMGTQIHVSVPIRER